MKNDSIFLTFFISEFGIELSSEQNTSQFFDGFSSSSGGTAKFSPDGTKYALYNYYDQLHIYDFDRATGKLSNHRRVEIFADEEIDRESIRFSSVEWSPNSRFVYCASSLDLHQVDMWEDDPQEGVRHIATYEDFQDPFSTHIYLQALAPDCRIYIAPSNSSYSYHVINRPNELGTACSFVQNGIKLPGDAAGGSFPNHPRFRVDEEEKCDPTITSVFGDAVYYRRELSTYPNPTTGPITVTMPDGFTSGDLVILDINGRALSSESLSAGTITKQLSLESYPAGVYNVELYPTSNRDRIFYGSQVVRVE